MDIQSYQIVLKDLEGKKGSLFKEINKIDDAINVIKSLIDTDLPSENFQPKNESLRARTGAKPAQRLNKITLTSGTEQILKDAGTALHIDEIVKRFETVFGRKTTNRSLNSTLMQDGKKRFVLLGKNVFDLESRPSDSFFQEFDLFNKKGSEKSGFSLIDAVRDEIKALEGAGFGVAGIYDILHARFPNEVDESRRRSVGSTINNLTLKGEIIKVRKGNFDKPAIYKAKNTEEK